MRVGRDRVVVFHVRRRGRGSAEGEEGGDHGQDEEDDDGDETDEVLERVRFLLLLSIAASFARATTGSRAAELMYADAGTAAEVEDEFRTCIKRCQLVMTLSRENP